MVTYECLMLVAMFFRNSARAHGLYTRRGGRASPTQRQLYQFRQRVPQQNG